MKQWYRFEAKADDPSAVDVYIDNYIGSWDDDLVNQFYGVEMSITAKQFIAELNALPASVKSIRVHVNSLGGDVFGAINIANALRDQRVTKGRKVEGVVDGIAASAATLVLMGCDPVRMADNALLMVHNPWAVAQGNAAEMRKQAETLDQVRDAIVVTYQWHAELSDTEIVELLDAETWMDADEAVARGFANEKVAGLRAQASIDPRSIARMKVPARFAAQVAALVAAKKEDDKEQPCGAEDKACAAGCSCGGKKNCPCAGCDDPKCPCCPGMKKEGKKAAATADVTVKVDVDVKDLMGKLEAATEVMRLCAEAGLDVAFAQALVEKGTSAADAAQLIVAEKGIRDARVRDEAEVRALCEHFGVPEVAGKLVEYRVGAEAARALILEFRAAMDKAQRVDGAINPGADGRPASGSAEETPAANPAEFYAKRNGLTARKG